MSELEPLGHGGLEPNRPAGARLIGVRVKPALRLAIGFKDPEKRGAPTKTDYFIAKDGPEGEFARESELKRREDDVEEAIRVRLANYHFMTEPLERYDREKGVLLMLKGDQSIDYVHDTLMMKLARLGFTP